MSVRTIETIVDIDTVQVIMHVEGEVLERLYTYSIERLEDTQQAVYGIVQDREHASGAWIATIGEKSPVSRPSDQLFSYLVAWMQKYARGKVRGLRKLYSEKGDTVYCQRKSMKRSIHLAREEGIVKRMVREMDPIPEERRKEGGFTHHGMVSWQWGFAVVGAFSATDDNWFDLNIGCAVEYAKGYLEDQEKEVKSWNGTQRNIPA